MARVAGGVLSAQPSGILKSKRDFSAGALAQRGRDEHESDEERDDVLHAASLYQKPVATSQLAMSRYIVTQS